MSAHQASAYSLAVFISSSWGTTRFTTPSRSASRASILREEKSRSSAWAGPTRRPSNQLTPHSAINPRLENARVNDAWSEAKRMSQASRQSKRLRDGSYISIELNTRTPVPEWDGQEVYIMMEDPAHLDSEGYHFFRPRQQSFYLIGG